MPLKPHKSRTALVSRPAFTLIELITVVSILVLIVAVAMPMIPLVRRAAGAESAVNTVNGAVTTAQAWARNNATVFSLTPGQTYQGMVLYFDPAGSPTNASSSMVMRLLQSIERYPGVTTAPWIPNATATWNVYADVPEWDPIPLPGGTTAYGITVGLGSNPGQVMTSASSPLASPVPQGAKDPAFALHINGSGNFVVPNPVSSRPSPDPDAVYYAWGSTPSFFDGASATPPPVWAAVGLVLYPTQNAAAYASSTSPLASGQILVFSPNSGTIMKERKQ
jgi:prepilin-type N-terminal cleavage/methylation domain-containing protein